MAPGTRTATMTLYNDFVRCCASGAIEVLTMKAFSMALER